MRKKDIPCKFLTNCKNGKDCEYLHPENKVSKNGEKEMHETMHFLKKEMVKMRQDMKKMMTQREEDRQNMKKVWDELMEVKLEKGKK